MNNEDLKNNWFHHFRVTFLKQVKKGKPKFKDVFYEKVIGFQEQPTDVCKSMATFSVEQKAKKSKWLFFEILEVSHIKSEQFEFPVF